MHETEVSIFIEAPIEKVWAAITDPQVMRQWMEDNPKIEVDLRPGGAFRYFDGQQTGRFTRVEAPHTLEHTWRVREWDSGTPDSTVGWRLKAVKGGTDVVLFHDGYPRGLVLDYDAGWDVNWLGPLKEWLEA